MSVEVAERTITGQPAGAAQPNQLLHALHIKSLPYAVWCRVHHNARLSQMQYRDYVIKILAECMPFQPTDTSEE